MKTLSTVWDFLKRHTLIILIALAGLLYWQNSRLAYSNSVLSAKIVADNTKFETWRDELGRENARQKLEQVYLTQLSAEARQRLEQEAHLIGVAIDKISNLTQVSTKTEGDFHTKTDTAGNFKWTDNYLTLNGKATDSTVGGKYIYVDTASIAMYDTAKKFLGITYRKDQFMNVRFNNPKTQITGLSNISLRDYSRPKHWVVSVGGGYGLTPTGLDWNASINVGYKLFEF